MSKAKERTTRQLQTFLRSRLHPMSDETYDEYRDIMRKLRRLDRLMRQPSQAEINQEELDKAFNEGFIEGKSGRE